MPPVKTSDAVSASSAMAQASAKRASLASRAPNPYHPDDQVQDYVDRNISGQFSMREASFVQTQAHPPHPQNPQRTRSTPARTTSPTTASATFVSALAPSPTLSSSSSQLKSPLHRCRVLEPANSRPLRGGHPQRVLRAGSSFHAPAHLTFSQPLSSGHQQGEAQIVHLGPLVVRTGQHTGRAAGDKFIVDEPNSREHVAWGDVNKPISEDAFDWLRRKAVAYLQNRQVYCMDVYAGADPAYRMRVRVITEVQFAGGGGGVRLSGDAHHLSSP